MGELSAGAKRPTKRARTPRVDRTMRSRRAGAIDNSAHIGTGVRNGRMFATGDTWPCPAPVSRLS
ncbi:MAG: hypothetical protein D6725_01125 [Planctomycetota bacterium]|nr:MAG: hypothetical protein D6725_01125 [Planctomycetota bacterium]